MTRAFNSTASSFERAGALWSTLAASAIGITLFSGVTTPVRFISEHIVVKTGADDIVVEGVYEYHNSAPFPTALRLGVPFPVDSDHPPPTELALDEVDEDGRCMRALLPVVHGADVSVRFFFMPLETRRLRLRYTQPTGVPRGRYILTTTREWRRPLERASFELHLARGAALSDSNYGLRRLGGHGVWIRYGFDRTGFWPDHDWDFAWEAS